MHALISSPTIKKKKKPHGIKFGTKSNFMSVTFVLAGSTPATMK